MIQLEIGNRTLSTNLFIDYVSIWIVHPRDGFFCQSLPTTLFAAILWMNTVPDTTETTLSAYHTSKSITNRNITIAEKYFSNKLSEK